MSELASMEVLHKAADSPDLHEVVGPRCSRILEHSRRKIELEAIISAYMTGR